MVVGLVIGGLALAGAASAASQEEAQGQTSTVGGRSIDAHQIYEQIKGGPGPTSLEQGRQSAGTLQQRYEMRAQTISQLNRKMEAAWTGEGGSGAARGAEPLKVWMEDSHTNLGHASTAMDDQYGAFTTVDRKVRPLPKEKPESGILNDINPLETDLDQKIQQYNEDAQTNVDAFDEYYRASSTNAQRMPAYSTMEGEYGGVDVKTKPKDGGTPDNPGSGPGTGGGGSYTPGGSSYTPGGGGGGSYTPSTVPTASTGPGGAGGGGNYSPGDIPGNVTPPGGGSSTVPDYTGPGTGGSDFDDNSTGASSYTPPSYNSSGFGPGTGGFGPGTGGLGSAGSGSGSYGSGGGYGGAGAGGAGGYGAGAAAGGFGPRGSSLGSGAATGSAAPGSGSAGGGYSGGARTGSAGSGSGMGRPMMGGMGAGQGKGSEDEEHERKYLIQEDGNSLFGTDEMTAPPVIGE